MLILKPINHCEYIMNISMYMRMMMMAVIMIMMMMLMVVVVIMVMMLMIVVIIMVMHMAFIIFRLLRYQHIKIAGINATFAASADLYLITIHMQ